MTQSLKERLAERLESQTAEIEAMTAAELKKLADAAQKQATTELERMKRGIHEQSAEMSETLRQLSWLKNVVAVTWGCLIVSLMVAGLLIWRSEQERPPFMALPIVTSGEAAYALLPAGSRVIECRLREELVPCMEIPTAVRD